jgi:hypothetical protein
MPSTAGNTSTLRIRHTSLSDIGFFQKHDKPAHGGFLSLLKPLFNIITVHYPIIASPRRAWTISGIRFLQPAFVTISLVRSFRSGDRSRRNTPGQTLGHSAVHTDAGTDARIHRAA